jgi:hypothetical protein
MGTNEKMYMKKSVGFIIFNASVLFACKKHYKGFFDTLQ